MKYVSIDIETTGDDPSVDEIVEFAAVIEDTQYPEIPVEDLPSFQSYIIKHEERYSGKPFVLGMHKLIWERIADRTDGYNYNFASQITDKFFVFLEGNGFTARDDGIIRFNVAGKNYAGFDQKFIERHLPNWTDCLRSIRRVIDPAVLYYETGDDQLPNTATCIERAGLNDPVSHEALADAQTVIRLIRNKI